MNPTIRACIANALGDVYADLPPGWENLCISDQVLDDATWVILCNAISACLAATCPIIGSGVIYPFRNPGPPCKTFNDLIAYLNTLCPGVPVPGAG
jgi:hypothetical protein